MDRAEKAEAEIVRLHRFMRAAATMIEAAAERIPTNNLRARQPLATVVEALRTGGVITAEETIVPVKDIAF